MRRWEIVGGIALGVAFGVALGRFHWTVDPKHAATDLARALQGLHAPSIGAPTDVTLQLLPRPTLRFSNFNARSADNDYSLDAETVEATLRWDRLLLGQYAPAGVTLRNFHIWADVDALGDDSADGVGLAPNRLSLEDGTVTLEASRQAWTTRVDIDSLAVNWSGSAGPLRATGTGQWRGQPLQASAEVSAPLALMQEGGSAVRFAIDGPLAQLRYGGDWAPKGGLEHGADFSGQFSALVPSIARFSRWMGVESPPALVPTGVELQAHASGQPSAIRLSDARIVLGGQTFEGALDVDRTAKGVATSGTLAADQLDLDALIGAPPPLLEDGGAWSARAVLPAPSERFDLDLRASVAHATWGAQRFENAAAAVSQLSGRLSVKLLEAGFAGGALSGEFSEEAAGGADRDQFAVMLENADLSALASAVNSPALTGRGTIRATFHARGRAPATVVASADGDGQLEIADGELPGVNFEEALRRSQRRPLDVEHDMNAGATRFAQGSGKLEIGEGEVRFLDTTTETPGVKLTLTGALDLINRAWRARIDARQNGDEPAADLAHIDFDLNGPWNAPTLAPLQTTN